MPSTAEQITTQKKDASYTRHLSYLAPMSSILIRTSSSSSTSVQPQALFTFQGLSPFLSSVPREIRDKIYESVLSEILPDIFPWALERPADSSLIYYSHGPGTSSLGARDIHAGLFTVCKQTRTEATMSLLRVRRGVLIQAPSPANESGDANRPEFSYAAAFTAVLRRSVGGNLITNTLRRVEIGVVVDLDTPLGNDNRGFEGLLRDVREIANGLQRDQGVRVEVVLQNRDDDWGNHLRWRSAPDHAWVALIGLWSNVLAGLKIAESEEWFSKGFLPRLRVRGKHGKLLQRATRDPLMGVLALERRIKEKFE